jgi:hypothetical protein
VDEILNGFNYISVLKRVDLVESYSIEKFRKFSDIAMETDKK